MPTTQLAHFTLGPVLGVGKTGTVFRALDTREGTEVALKVFSADFSANEEDVQRFSRAAKTIMPLNHLNLVTLTGAGRLDGHCWLSMELIEGPGLGWLVKQSVTGQTDWHTGLRVLHHGTRALVYLHGKRVLHRNLTPENMLLNRADGLIKVGDVITAKAQEGKQMGGDITSTGEVIGDPLYMAPERLIGGPSSGDERSDLYGLGAVVYAVLTGHPPFEGKNAAEVRKKIMEQAPVPVRNLRADVPYGLDLVVTRLLSRAPEQRFESATELLRALVQQRLVD
jgi:serine/threonine-protein kinase